VRLKGAQILCEALVREGCQPTYKKVKGFQPLQLTWGPFVVDALFRGGKKHGNAGAMAANLVRDNVAFLRRRFAEEGVDIGKSTSQVMPVLVNDDAKVFRVAEMIQERGLYLQPVTYPAVPKHKSRLRISVSAAHTEADLEQAVQVIAGVLRDEGVSCR